jgi:glycosyltransferase involved in cell wall biosynthesis
MKKKYLINGFSFLYDVFKKDDSYEYINLTPPHYKYTPLEYYYKNIKIFSSLKKTSEINKFDVIHLNSWDSILMYNPKNKLKNQITIAEAHGFFVGLNFDATINELPVTKKIPNKILKILFDKKMRERLKRYDIFYVSTPNMLVHAKKIRKDAIWLPNPIDTKTFNPIGKKIKLDGNPSVFLPTRLHAFKNPLYGINVFKKIKKKYPHAKLHMINYGGGADPLFNAFKKIIDEKEVIYHDRMSRDELAKYYRSADIVLGQFNEVLGNFSMIELEAMACGAPIVTLDKYEIKKEFEKLENLEKLAFKLIKDKKFKDKFVKRNMNYVRAVHSENSVINLNIKTIQNKKTNKLSE